MLEEIRIILSSRHIGALTPKLSIEIPRSRVNPSQARQKTYFALRNFGGHLLNVFVFACLERLLKTQVCFLLGSPSYKSRKSNVVEITFIFAVIMLFRIPNVPWPNFKRSSFVLFWGFKFEIALYRFCICKDIIPVWAEARLRPRSQALVS